MLAPRRGALFCITSLSLQLIVTIFSEFCVPLEVCFDRLKFLLFRGNLGPPKGFLRGARHRWSIQKLFKSRQAILLNRHGPLLPKIEVAFLSTHGYNYRIRTQKNMRLLGLNPRPWAWLERHEFDTLDRSTTTARYHLLIFIFIGTLSL